MARWRKLGVIAGAGALPLRIAEACKAAQAEVFFIRLEGVADPSLADYPGADCAVGEAGKIIRNLKQAGCDAAVYAGVVKRPDFSKLKADWRGAALMPKIIKAAASGDGAILNVLVETLEAEGFLVIGPEEIVDNVACRHGAIGRLRPDAANFADIRKAAAIVHALGPFDVGQGAVVANGFVLAIEAAEGTDAMLDRCAGLPNDASRRGVLVKRPKPGQELRIDLPVIGPETVRRAAKANLAGIAVEAGCAIIIDPAETAALADEAGLFVYGFNQQDIMGGQ